MGAGVVAGFEFCDEDGASVFGAGVVPCVEVSGAVDLAVPFGFH